MRRVIGPLPLEQGPSLEDMIDHDGSTMAAWCQRGGMGAHGPPAVTVSHPAQLCKNSYKYTQHVYAHVCHAFINKYNKNNSKKILLDVVDSKLILKTFPIFCHYVTSIFLK